MQSEGCFWIQCGSKESSSRSCGQSALLSLMDSSTHLCFETEDKVTVIHALFPILLESVLYDLFLRNIEK